MKEELHSVAELNKVYGMPFPVNIFDHVITGLLSKDELVLRVVAALSQNVHDHFSSPSDMLPVSNAVVS